jgi:hypothetical protein
MAEAKIRIEVKLGDALDLSADVLVLKHAQAMYGVDAAAYRALSAKHDTLDLPRVGKHMFVQTRGLLGAARILFIGVVPIRQFEYEHIRELSRRAMSILAADRESVRRVAFTLHGAGFGLDEKECFESEAAGVLAAIEENDYPPALEEVIFIERDAGRAKRLKQLLNNLLPNGIRINLDHGPRVKLEKTAKEALRSAGVETKPRVFVAMPFVETMSDVFDYGIQGAANSTGLLAERADLQTYTGDVVEWIRARISGAKFVVAVLTNANPNVYLEVGYAWGQGVPTVLLAASKADIKFDLQGQRCLLYSTIKDLETKLARELSGLLEA